MTYTAAGTRMNSASRTRCEAFRDPHGSRLVHSSSYSANSLRPLYRHDRITDYGGRNRRNERAREGGRFSEQRLDWLAARSCEKRGHNYKSFEVSSCIRMRLRIRESSHSDDDGSVTSGPRP